MCTLEFVNSYLQCSWPDCSQEASHAPYIDHDAIVNVSAGIFTADGPLDRCSTSPGGPFSQLPPNQGLVRTCCPHLHGCSGQLVTADAITANVVKWSFLDVSKVHYLQQGTASTGVLESHTRPQALVSQWADSM